MAGCGRPAGLDRSLLTHRWRFPRLGIHRQGQFLNRFLTENGVLNLLLGQQLRTLLPFGREIAFARLYCEIVLPEKTNLSRVERAVVLELLWRECLKCRDSSLHCVALRITLQQGFFSDILD
jgi:hypothetical protein